MSSRKTRLLPKFGQTRCYWSLLDEQLNFLHFDPVLTAHIAEEKEALLGRCLLDFVHPEEQSSARQDLRKVLDGRNLHGSVTRVRYARLSRIRSMLGCEAPPSFPHAEKVAFDDTYIGCDVVINWVADNLVLCFIHAIVDTSPGDNDEHRKTDWTNWCETPFMDHEQSSILYRTLMSRSPPPNDQPPDRVFQILLNDQQRSILFSWPIDGYQPQDYGKLALDVQIGGENDGKATTSCTRRYKALQVMTCEDAVREVESIYIPHGSIIFACHKVNRTQSLPQEPSFSYNSTSTPYLLTSSYPNSGGYNRSSQQSSPQPTSYHTSQTSPYATPAIQAAFAPGSQSNWPLATSATSSQRGSDQRHSGWTSSSHSPTPDARSSSSTHFPGSSWSPSGFSTSGENRPVYRLPPPNRSTSPRQSSTIRSPIDGPQVERIPAVRPARPGSPGRRESTGARVTGNPPAGVKSCAHCGSTTSPEWRKGPSGMKDLCNACGLRYSRSKQKEKGVGPRRTKDKADGSAPAPATGQQESRGQKRKLPPVHGGAIGAISSESNTPSPSPGPGRGTNDTTNGTTNITPRSAVQPPPGISSQSDSQQFRRISPMFPDGMQAPPGTRPNDAPRLEMSSAYDPIRRTSSGYLPPTPVSADRPSAPSAAEASAFLPPPVL